MFWPTLAECSPRCLHESFNVPNSVLPVHAALFFPPMSNGDRSTCPRSCPCEGTVCGALAELTVAGFCPSGAGVSSPPIDFVVSCWKVCGPSVVMVFCVWSCTAGDVEGHRQRPTVARALQGLAHSEAESFSSWTHQRVEAGPIFPLRFSVVLDLFVCARYRRRGSDRPWHEQCIPERSREPGVLRLGQQRRRACATEAGADDCSNNREADTSALLQCG